ncbi:MAG: 5-formyltetrahydrofolate cyclo-ligase [Deltaproteobacteria bacterium]
MSQRVKQQLRRELLARGSRLSPDERAAASRAVVEGLWALPELAGARLVQLFAALPTEPDLEGLFAALLERGTQVAFPGFAADRAPELRIVTALGGLSLGERGFRQPGPGPRVPVESVDLFVVPGVAFDRVGQRLGRGLGYFDRLLAGRRPEATAVGVGFSHSLVERLPDEPHDQRVDVVITPDERLRFRPR